jgi:hypothetical protein
MNLGLDEQRLAIILEAIALVSSATTVVAITAALVALLCSETAAACVCAATAAFSLGFLGAVVYTGLRLSHREGGRGWDV